MRSIRHATAPRGSRPRRAGALAIAGLLAAAPALLGASAAHADSSSGDDLVAYARAQLLGGSVVGSNLSNLADLRAAIAANGGSVDEVVDANPLAVDVLRSISLELPNGVALDVGEGIDAGAVQQWAGAWSDSSAEAHVLTLGDAGAVDVRPSAADASGSVVVDLSALLGSRFANSITSLDLRLSAIGASAEGHGEVATGDYSLAGAQLLVRTPALTDLSQRVFAALEPAESRLASLGGSSGHITQAVRHALGGVLGGDANLVDVDVAIDTDLRSAVEPLLTARLDSPGASVDLERGAIVLDLETILGRDLNSLPPGTELLSESVLVPVLDSITTHVANLADDVVDVVREAINEVRVDIRATLSLLTPQQGDSVETCVEVPILGNLGGGDGVVGGLLDGLTGGLLGGGGGHGGTGHVTEPLTELVCTITEKVLPDLRTSLDLRIAGDLSGLGDADAEIARATLTVLGVPVQLDLSAVLGGISLGIADALGNESDVIAAVQSALQQTVVEPVATGLLGGASLGTALADVLSVKVNLKSTGSDSAGPGTFFTQTAVRIAVLQGALVSIDLASATVGPGVTPTDDPEDPDGPGGPGDPDCTGDDCGPGGPITLSDGGPLAYTGVNIGGLLMLIAGLLAAGLALMRARHGSWALSREVLLG
ncbi:choice-of-anchor G family protein [Microcella sp.]|uniref:choice-of-anchor G family protein n=1 Tax=Microcella sp. TaxID=1913979 RepID=UPI00256754F1|nr:choice-of-anchor G family protein [Microcella sp.]MBX9472243.1 choice-of-anchor G family protein [Microcella sp.]